jgi:hypothetical protein
VRLGHATSSFWSASKVINIADGEMSKCTKRARLTLLTGAVCLGRDAKIEFEEPAGVHCLHGLLGLASRRWRMAYGRTGGAMERLRAGTMSSSSRRAGAGRGASFNVCLVWSCARPASCCVWPRKFAPRGDCGGSWGPREEQRPMPTVTEHN